MIFILENYHIYNGAVSRAFVEVTKKETKLYCTQKFLEKKIENLLIRKCLIYPDKHRLF